MNKHAYLIISHNNFEILKKLVQLIDDERNDIFIHIDAKVEDFDFYFFSNLPQKSNIYFTDRISVSWGGFSQIESELILLESASKYNYEYYHLLSGVDMPLKTQDYIHDFFEKNKGKEFLGYSKKWDKTRVKYKFYYNEILRHKNNSLSIVYKKLLNKIFLVFQVLLIINKSKEINFYKGTNWFSITDELVKYIIKNKQEINKIYKHSILCDEVFIHTLVMNSSFKDRLYRFYHEDEYEANLRYIDWVRGNPYVFKVNDFDSLINSEFLFARKFDEKVDFDIVKKIFINLKDKSYE
ncbi:beta-1,6-N-acetylglucosaminyltransferase [Gottfriedia sp. NPDC057948]|uniref:beta-1,6-N-acetylglucosaminyltransferase n=1 Tax=Gottfriedia sp. NPDC057948 TaxID=3346287 RepID=UPI0036D78678